MPSVTDIMLVTVASIALFAASTTAFLPSKLISANYRTTFSQIPFQTKRASTTTTTTAPHLFAQNDAVDDDGKTKLTIALTRESGKNDKLKEEIANHPTSLLLADTLTLNTIEMPCVQHAVGPDVESFAELVGTDAPCTVLKDKFDYIVVTSPEGATVLAELLIGASEEGGGDTSSLSSLPMIAAVGKATEKTLVDLGFTVSFTPSKANGETLAEELPPVDKVKLNKVLYPASARADSTVKEKLEGRKDCSFLVSRFDTYDTVPVVFDEGEREVMMDKVDMAMFGSPSAVKAWIENVDLTLGISEEDGSLEERKKAGGNCNGDVLAVCIGKTTAKACLESKRWVSNDIYYPSNNPGMKGWVDSCLIAAGDEMEKNFWG